MYLVECYNDGTVLLALGLERIKVKRLYGKGNVIRELRKPERQPVVAMMDMDRNKTGTQGLAGLQVLDKLHGLELLGLATHRIIMVDDYLEDWLVRISKSAGVRLPDFGLPEDARSLHRQEAQEANPKLTALVQHLAEVRSPGMMTLIRYLGIERRQDS